MSHNIIYLVSLFSYTFHVHHNMVQKYFHPTTTFAFYPNIRPVRHSFYTRRRASPSHFPERIKTAEGGEIKIAKGGLEG